MSIKVPKVYERWEFENHRLRKSTPQDIINQNIGNRDDERSQEFLLTLALVFNDFKGLVLINDSIKGVYRTPNPEEVTTHVGELNGIQVQILKLLFSTLFEAIVFIRDSKDAYTLPHIQTLLKSIPESSQIVWDVLRKVADEELIEDARFTGYAELRDLLKLARNNVGFHYQTRKRLVAGYRRFFYDNNDIATEEYKKIAYRSTLSGNFADSRYYYADAALQGYYLELFGNHRNPQQLVDDTFNLIAMVVHAINDLLIAHHKSLPNR